MKRNTILTFILSFLFCFSYGQKQRVLVLTDIQNEPDDAMSLVRFLTYSNMWDVEGLIATTSVHQPNNIADWRIHEIVTAYGKVRSNLLLHENGFPEEDYLHGIIKKGLPLYGMEAVGKDKDSQGSDWIISVVDKEDERPVWVTVWGGANCLAQALWKVSMTRTSFELEKFVSKLRVYTISDQDNSGNWIRKTFPKLFYIASPGIYSLGGYHHATWSGISGDKFHGRFTGGNFKIVSNPWLDINIRSKGALGAEYPQVEYLMEGDTPSFLYLVNNGLGDSEHPNWGSWGGRYELYTPHKEKWFPESETRPLWTNAEDEALGFDGHWHTDNKATIWRWREAFQNDFSARMDWSVKKYNEANHPPIANLAHSNLLTVKSGETVYLDASNSVDPDKNNLHFEWIYYQEAGTYSNNDSIEIKNKNTHKATFVAPVVNKPETIHVIAAVNDDGIPSLTRYKRVVVSVLPSF